MPLAGRGWWLLSRDLKARIRERIWRLMEERDIARFPRPVYGRIPNFEGAEEAARLAAGLKVFRDAEVVKANPDSPQRWLRLEALLQGKVLVMATPRLREGFLLIDPRRVPYRFLREASTIRGAFRFGERLPTPRSLARLSSIDLIVTGSVAVSPQTGARIGKGEGYAELEYAILRELGLVGEETPIITTVHEVQLVPDIPAEPHDVAVDIVVTPRRVIRVKNRPPRPPGILWESLSSEKLEAIPLLRMLRDGAGL